MVSQAGVPLGSGFDMLLHGSFLFISSLVGINCLWDAFDAAVSSIKHRSFLIHLFFSRIKSREWGGRTRHLSVTHVGPPSLAFSLPGLAVIGLSWIAFFACDTVGVFAFVDNRLGDAASAGVTARASLHGAGFVSRRLCELIQAYFAAWLAVVLVHVALCALRCRRISVSLKAFESGRSAASSSRSTESRRGSDCESDSGVDDALVALYVRTERSFIRSQRPPVKHADGIRVDRLIDGVCASEALSLVAVPWLELATAALLSWVVVSGALVDLSGTFPYLPAADDFAVLSSWGLLMSVCLLFVYCRRACRRGQVDEDLIVGLCHIAVLCNSFTFVYVAHRMLGVWPFPSGNLGPQRPLWAACALVPALAVMVSVVPRIMSVLPFGVVASGSVSDSLISAAKRKTQ